MAKLSPGIRLIVSSQKEQLLDIIDESKSLEFILLERFGENPETIATLDQLLEIAEQARVRFSQLSNLQLRIAEAQPIIPPDLLRLMNEAITNLENRIPALNRSIEEIQLDWGLL